MSEWVIGGNVVIEVMIFWEAQRRCFFYIPCVMYLPV